MRNASFSAGQEPAIGSPNRGVASEGEGKRAFPTYLQVTALALILGVVTFAVWRILFHQSDFAKGLGAMNAAYRKQRPLESRLSALKYAPFSETVDRENEGIDTALRDRAERILLAAEHDHPGPVAEHALGQFYLTEKQFGKATEKLANALKADPRNSQIFSDLGAAFLEQGKQDLGGTNPGKAFEELAQGAENAKQALDLDPNLTEALFNNALCHRYLMLKAQATADWREYVKRDATSPWAGEAREYLKQLETQQTKNSQTQDQLIRNFLAAYESENDVAAWAAIRPSRARTGNAIVEALLDDFLNLANSDRSAEAQSKLRMLFYEARIEEAMAGDKFTSDVVHFYASATLAQRQTISQARNLMRDANQRYTKAEFQQASDLYSSAHQLFAQARDEAELLVAEAWVGYCYLRIPDPAKSIQTFERLSTIFETRRYRSLFAQSLIGLADAFNGRNEYSKVLAQANRALVVAEMIQDDAAVVRCLQSETTTQLLFGDYGESLRATARALNLAETLPRDPKLTWPFFHEASLAFYFLGAPATAIQFETEALRLATVAGLSLHASRSYDRLGLLYGRLGNYDAAIKNTEQARAVGETVKDELPRTNILAHSALNLGKLYRESGDPRRALAYYDQAIDLYKKLNVDIYQYEAHKGKLLALIALKDDAVADIELKTVLYWFEQNRTKIAEESFRNKFFDTDQNTYDVAVDFEYSRKKDIAKAFEYAEAYRARQLLDLMNGGGRFAGNETIPEITLPSAAMPFSVAEIKKKLPAEAQLLEYSVLEDKVVMWVINNDEVRAVEVKLTRVDLEQKIREFVGALSHPGRSGADPESLAKELYASLIAPAESLLDHNRSLCIVADQNLNFVPFGALRSPSSSRYLIEDFAIEMAPSASVFISSSENAKQRITDKSERILAVGAPSFDKVQFSDLPELWGAKREAQEIAALYGANPLSGKAAVFSRVSQLMKEAEVIHFATHAVVDENSPLLSKLLLSKAESDGRETNHAALGFLQASDIYGMNLHGTHLVVLSACQTGIERAYRGEGAIGLARPFIAAGVPIVVASLWPVDSETTADLMISFHKHRKQDHISSVEALRRAQRDFLHNPQSNSQRNYDWAAFIAIGGHTSF